MGKQSIKQLQTVMRHRRPNGELFWRAHHVSRNKYPKPHQGARECDRRRGLLSPG